jgi:hypothetical protein
VAVQSHVLYLQELDDLWTAQVEAMRSGEVTWSPEAADELGVVVGAMRDGLHVLEDRGREVRYQLEALTPEQVEEAARRIDPEGSLSIVLDEDFDLRGSVLGAWIYVLDEAARERGLLTEKYNRIRQGDIPDGDFRFSFKCALYLTAVGAGIAAAVVTGGGAVAVGLTLTSATAGAGHGWTDSGCRRAGPEIGGRR